MINSHPIISLNHLGDIKDKTIGIARADVPNPELIGSLESKGAIIIEAPAYRLEAASNSILEVLNDVDAVIFTSAKSFELSGFRKEDATKIKSIAIGKKTADAMRKSGNISGFCGKWDSGGLSVFIKNLLKKYRR